MWAFPFFLRSHLSTPTDNEVVVGESIGLACSYQSMHFNILHDVVDVVRLFDLDMCPSLLLIFIRIETRTEVLSENFPLKCLSFLRLHCFWKRPGVCYLTFPYYLIGDIAFRGDCLSEIFKAPYYIEGIYVHCDDLSCSFPPRLPFHAHVFVFFLIGH